MARPTKQGIDYFPVDCQFDTKTQMYLVETEGNGLAVLISLWQLIYSDLGYYIKNDDDLCLLIKKQVNIPIEEITKCVRIATKRDLFDQKMSKKYDILTSKAIQKRFFEAAKRKKKVKFNSKYIINGIDVCNNSIDVCNNATKEDVDVEVEVEVKKRLLSDDQINTIYFAYPKKEGKAKGYEKLRREKSELFNLILNKVREYALSRKDENSKYTKMFSTWVNQKGWDDEISKKEDHSEYRTAIKNF